MEAVAAAMGTQESPEGRARIRGQSHSHQLDSCLLRYGPVQATPGRPVARGPAHQACYLCSLLFPTSLPLLGWGRGVEGCVSWHPYCGEKDHHRGKRTTTCPMLSLLGPALGVSQQQDGLGPLGASPRSPSMMLGGCS